MNLRNLSGKSRRIKDASSRGIKLPTSNLYFYGTKYDINGNKCAVFSFGANSRKWSVQTSSYGISKGISYMPSNTKPEDILNGDYGNGDVASKLEQNVINYINEFGSSNLKSQLYIYDSVMDSRRVSDGIGTNAMNLNGYKAYIKDMETYTNKISDEELQSWFKFPSSKEFYLKDFLNGVADIAENLGDLIVLKYSKTTGWYSIELDGNAMDALISFTVEKVESSPNFVRDIQEYFGDKAIVE